LLSDNAKLTEELKDSDAGVKEIIEENAELKKDCADLNKQFLDKFGEVQKLTQELESKTVPQTEPEDGDLDGVPWSQLSEDKLVKVVRAQGAMLNKQARKLKKYKKQKK